MPFWKRRPKYEEPVEAETVAPEPTNKESRQLAKLRKKAQKAARRAARESERAREAAQKVQQASSASSQETRAKVAEPREDVPDGLAGTERKKVLAKKEQRRLKRLRQQAKRSS